MALEKIIVLDDQEVIRKSLAEQLRRRRYAVATAGTLGEAEALLAADSFDLIFVDVRLPDGDGTDLLERLAPRPDRPLTVMITGHGSIESAVKCMQMGAFDYLIKPFSAEQIEVLLKKAEDHSQLVKVSQYFSSEQTGNDMDLLGESAPMLHLKRMIRKVAATEATVLINGESGTGKELVARELYRLSPLSSRPYIKVNCAAINESLIESEFFGHEKGSFTGATQRREGRFELADNGTILLDEISEVAPRVQAKLLRVLQEKEFERVGGNKTMQVNVRVFATTNRQLLKCVQEGDFREDLYYRLNVFPIVVPPLRERLDDVPLLVERFVERSARSTGIKVAGVSEKALAAMQNYEWPGNVRELQNTIERAVILTEPGKAIQPSNLFLGGQQLAGPPRARVATSAEERAPSLGLEGGGSSSEPPSASGDRIGTNGHTNGYGSSSPGTSGHGSGHEARSVAEVERDHILSVLAETGGNRNQASEMLQISIRTLRNKLNLYREQGFEIL